jgi:hypothetical protein
MICSRRSVMFAAAALPFLRPAAGFASPSSASGTVGELWGLSFWSPVGLDVSCVAAPIGHALLPDCWHPDFLAA